MTDLTNLDNDAFAAHVADVVHEMETRIEGSAHAKKRLWRIKAKRLHADLEELQEDIFGAGELTTRSGGSKSP